MTDIYTADWVYRKAPGLLRKTIDRSEPAPNLFCREADCMECGERSYVFQKASVCPSCRLIITQRKNLKGYSDICSFYHEARQRFSNSSERHDLWAGLGTAHELGTLRHYFLDSSAGLCGIDELLAALSRGLYHHSLKHSCIIGRVPVIIIPFGTYPGIIDGFHTISAGGTGYCTIDRRRADPYSSGTFIRMDLDNPVSVFSSMEAFSRRWKTNAILGSRSGILIRPGAFISNSSNLYFSDGLFG